jgi:soluble lytic murein transglycosylase
MPVDLFVESMPFKETRAYVKQVVADDYLYQAFYGGGEARRLAMTLPKPASNGIEF